MSRTPPDLFSVRACQSLVAARTIGGKVLDLPLSCVLSNIVSRPISLPFRAESPRRRAEFADGRSKTLPYPAQPKKRARLRGPLEFNRSRLALASVIDQNASTRPIPVTPACPGRSWCKHRVQRSRDR